MSDIKKKLEQEIRNYENGDFDRDNLISLIIDLLQKDSKQIDWTSVEDGLPGNKSQKEKFMKDIADEVYSKQQQDRLIKTLKMYKEYCRDENISDDEMETTLLDILDNCDIHFSR